MIAIIVDLFRKWFTTPKKTVRKPRLKKVNIIKKPLMKKPLRDFHPEMQCKKRGQ